MSSPPIPRVGNLHVPIDGCVAGSDCAADQPLRVALGQRDVHPDAVGRDCPATPCRLSPDP